MKVEGLGDERRSALFQIRCFVEEVEGFTADHFKQIISQHKEKDPIMHKVLEDSRQVAESRYNRYLNSLLVKSNFGVATLEIFNSSDEGTVYGKVMGELRERIKSEKDYCRQFLGPEIGMQTRINDIQLRKMQKDEIKHQRDEMKAMARSQRRSIFSLGR